MVDNLQVENGHFTRIVNPLMENLVKLPFRGSELAVAIYLIRKTYGFNKTEDEISLSQFQKGLGRSKQTIVTALKNLQLVNIAILVKPGTSKKHSNLWKINKYYKTWELVKIARLVKSKHGTSLTKGPQLVKIARHTKDNTKDNIQKTPPTGGSDIQKLVLEFYRLKGWVYNESTKAVFARHVKPAKDILELCTLDQAIEKVGKLAHWADVKQLDWSLNTILSKWHDLPYLDEQLENSKKAFIGKDRAYQKEGKWWVISNGEHKLYMGSPNDVHYEAT
jgi:phage replication O-like protein O